jgi:putative endonuclease
MRDEKMPAVYIVASHYRGTIYVGVTSAVWTRVAAHKDEAFKGFTSKYKLKSLVWSEHHHTMLDAIAREKNLKAWKRDWKFRLIESLNPDWNDLHDIIDPISTPVELKS